MDLNSSELELLRRVSASSVPVAPSSFFHDIHPPDFPREAAEDDPARKAWTARQLNLYGALLSLHEKELLVIVHLANRARPDLMEVTSHGREVLSSAGR